MGKRKKKLVKLWVELEIEATDPDDAFNVVDTLLENGCPQDEINDHQHEGAGALKVKTAICVSEDPATTALDALKKLLELVDGVLEETEGRYPSADPGCFECTIGTVPNRLNTGPCAYHAAKTLLTKAKAA